MSERSAALLIDDILEAASKIASYTAGMRIPVISDTDSGGKPDTHSSRSRTPIPVIPDTP
jgi:hypothetical protein